MAWQTHVSVLKLHSAPSMVSQSKSLLHARSINLICCLAVVLVVSRKYKEVSIVNLVTLVSISNLNSICTSERKERKMNKAAACRLFCQRL